ncbi:MAG: hypothetical protein DCC71_12160 [Proteobacteria bacterium]|nr:MAG: hypothetical protein DCC71_12160 [Pseudomonadota bacterium]
MTEVNVNVPLDLHPSRFDRLASHPDPAIAGRARAAQRAFEQAYARLSAVPSEEHAIKDNRDWSLEKKQRLIDETRAAAKAEAAATLGKLVEDLDGAVTYFQGKLDAAAGMKEAPTEVDREVRAHVRDLPTVEDRVSFLRKLAEKGDRASVAAVFRGQRFLSGLDDVRDEDFAGIRNDVLRLLAPEQHAALTTIERMRADVAAAIRLVG